MLLAVTYGLVVQAFVGKLTADALCSGPVKGGLGTAARSRCHTIGLGQERAMALSEHSAVSYTHLPAGAALR